MATESHKNIIARLKSSGVHPLIAQSSQFPKEPYKGLKYFSVSDGPIFGQRDRQTESCLALLNSSRVLILHGQSGAGKSSFLRAGLLRSLLCNQRFLTLANIDNPGEAYVVRATGDPIYRLHRALVVALRKDPVLRRWLTSEYADSLSTVVAEESIEETLKKICSRIPVPLIIAIDQAEEILTLVDQTIIRPAYSMPFAIRSYQDLWSGPTSHRPNLSEEQTGTPKDRFFELIERLCHSDIQLKLILALRTEYYGQFCDNFRVPPNNPLNPIKSGIESYWLSGLHTRDELTEAILLPQREFANAASSGLEVSPFEIEYDLPEHLVDDLLATKGAVSALPILQLVCKELYAAACSRAKQDGGPIKLRTADISKGVAGVVDEYIDQKIREVEKAVRGPPSNVSSDKWRTVLASFVDRQDGGVLIPRLTALVEKTVRGPPSNVSSDKWRTVLASLVGRQEGGVLITLLTPLAEISKRCSTAGLFPLSESGFRPYLDGLCATGLLRSVNYGDAKEPEYSLGHDALAPYLYRWHLEQATVRLAEKQYRRRARAFLVSALLIATAFYAFWVVPEYQKIKLLTTRDRDQFASRVSSALDLASVNEVQDAAARLRPALSALYQFQAAGLVDEELHSLSRQTVASLIERTPVRVGCADAIGIRDPLNDNAAKLTSFAFLNKTETCFDESREEAGVANASHVATDQLTDAGELTRTSDLSFPLAEKKEDSNRAFPSIPFVGFLHGTETPVLVSDRVISSENSEGSFSQVAVAQVFPETRRFVIFDTSEGALWAIGPSSSAETRTLILQSAQLDVETNQFQAGSISNLPLRLIWPVFSPWKAWLADIDQQASELRIRDRSGKDLSSWKLPETEWQDPVNFVFLRNQPIRPAGFVRNTSWIAIRTGPTSIGIYDVQGADQPTILDVPEDVRGDPLRPSWFNRRPPMAGVLEGGLLSLAWATRRGIEVVRWKFPDGDGAAEAPLIYSPDPGATIADLRFLPGNYLFVTITEPGTFALGFRLMDLDPTRRMAIEKLSDTNLLRIGCDRLTANHSGSSEATKMCGPFRG
jgi:hypothetical protein